MAWTGVWSLKVDGTELNDLVKYITVCPEIEALQPMRILLGQRDGAYPVYIRSQPAEGNYTFHIAMKNVTSDVIWNTRIAELQALFAQDAYHTLVAQVRGMPNARTLRFLTDSMTPDFTTKTVVVNTLAPMPVPV